MTEAGYLPRQVVEITGVPYSTLNLWAKTGFIVPSIDRGAGTGHQRIYSGSDLAELRIAHSMKAAGLPLAVIKLALVKFRECPKSQRVEVLLSREPEIYVSVRRP
jgi:DNA-binding transcriptional MerR regulator